MDTRQAAARILGAATPEDLFGPAAPDTAGAGRTAYHRLAEAVHPDRAPGAAAVFAVLADLYRQWRAAAAPPIDIHTLGAYTLGALHARGSASDLHHATGPDGAAVLLKIPRRASSNALATAEQEALRDLARLGRTATWLPHYVPRLVDAFTVKDPATGQRRHIGVLGALTDGFATLADVRRAYPGGLDERDWAWMHRRLLRALAAAHHAGWVHGAVLPENVLIHPSLHGVVLVGWSFATPVGGRPAATVTSQAATYAPEALAGGPVTGEADVYQLHTLMRHMLGGRETAPTRAYLDGCLHANPRLRPDAQSLTTEFDDLLERCHGARRFRPFDLPERV